MPDALVSAYDWTSSLEKQMMENVDSRSQKVFLKHCLCLNYFASYEHVDYTSFVYLAIILDAFGLWCALYFTLVLVN